MGIFKDIFSKTHQLYSQNFSTFVGITIIPFVYDFLITLRLRGMPDLSKRSIVFLIICTGIIAPLIHLISWMALSWAVSEAYLNHEVSFIDSYRRVLGKRILQVIFTYALMYIFLFLGFIFFIIPGVYLLVNYLFVPQAVIIEGLSGMKALQRSKDLIRSVFMKTCLFMILFAFIEGIIGITLGFNDAVRYLGTLLFTPLGTVFFTVYYYKMVKFVEALTEAG